MHGTILFAVEEAAKEGGLFDLDATLPLMAVQFLSSGSNFEPGFL